jgi:hypothetical protein
MNPALVMMTVNAPYRQKLDAGELAAFLRDHAAARTVPGHISSFFGDVQPALQLDFARMFNISEQELVAAAKAFSAYSGQSYPLAA